MNPFLSRLFIHTGVGGSVIAFIAPHTRTQSKLYLFAAFSFSWSIYHLLTYYVTLLRPLTPEVRRSGKEDGGIIWHLIHSQVPLSLTLFPSFFIPFSLSNTLSFVFYYSLSNSLIWFKVGRNRRHAICITSLFISFLYLLQKCFSVCLSFWCSSAVLMM